MTNLEKFTITTGILGIIFWIYFILTSLFVPFVLGIVFIWIFYILALLDFVVWYIEEKE